MLESYELQKQSNIGEQIHQVCFKFNEIIEIMCDKIRFYTL